MLGGGDLSAKRCQAALNNLLTKLKKRNESPSAHRDSSLATSQKRTAEERGSGTPNLGRRRSNKRPRLNGEGVPLESQPPTQALPSYDPFPSMAMTPGANFWQPVLEYTGPDFGFDSSIVNAYGVEQEQGGIALPACDIGAGGLYSDEMWEAYLQGAGDNLNF